MFIHRIILLFSVFVVSLSICVDAAEQVIFDPPPTTLCQSDLHCILTAWDDAIKGDLVDKKLNVMRQLSLKSNIKGVGSGIILKYNNPEIVERVAELYLKEAKRRPKPFREEDRVKESLTNPWYGAGEGYIELLASLAESSFSEKIYPMTIYPFDIQPLRELYLAKVNPELTLDYIFKSSIGTRNGQLGTFMGMYTKDETSYFVFDLTEAFSIINIMIDISPEIARQKRPEIMKFVNMNALYLSMPRQNYYDDKKYYHSVPDMQLREKALDILERLGSKDDMGLVEKIETNATEDVRTKAKQVKKRLSGIITNGQ